MSKNKYAPKRISEYVPTPRVKAVDATVLAPNRKIKVKGKKAMTAGEFSKTLTPWEHKALSKKARKKLNAVIQERLEVSLKDMRIYVSRKVGKTDKLSDGVVIQLYNKLMTL